MNLYEKVIIWFNKHEENNMYSENYWKIINLIFKNNSVKLLDNYL